MLDFEGDISCQRSGNKKKKKNFMKNLPKDPLRHENWFEQRRPQVLPSKDENQNESFE